MLKIEFDANNKELAAALGTALLQYGSGATCAQGTLELFSAPDPVVTDSMDEQVDAKDAPDTSTNLPPSSASDDLDLSKRPADEKGVPHHPELCVGLKSDKPFYQTGPQAGQWKKGRGVDENAYNEWYAAELAKLAPEETAPVEQEVDSSGAFGKQPEAAPAPQGFKSGGELMGWVAELNAAGKFKPEDVTQAYAAAGVSLGELFNLATEADAVAKVERQIRQMLGE